MIHSSDNVTLNDLAAQIEQLKKQLAAPPRRFLGVASAAGYSDLSVESIRRLLSAGKLTAHRPVKGRVLIDRYQLDSLILGATTTPRTGRGRGK